MIPKTEISTAAADPRGGRLTGLLIVGIFLVGADNMLVAAIAPQIARTLQVATGRVTLAITLYALFYGVCAPFVAPLSERLGRRMALAIFGLGFSFSNILVSLASNIWILYAGRILSGLFAGGMGPNLWAMVGDFFAKGKARKVTSWMMSAFSLSTVLGTPIAILAAARFGWRAIFALIAALVAFSAAALVLALSPKRKRTDLNKENGTLKRLLSTLCAHWRWCLAMLLSSAAYMGIYGIFPSYLSDYLCIPSGAVSLALFVIGISGFAGSLLVSFLFHGTSSQRLTRWSWGIVMLFAWLVAVPFIHENSLMLTILFAVWNLCSTLGNTAFVATLGERAHGERTRSMALNNTSIFLGFFIGSGYGSFITSHSFIRFIFVAIVSAILSIGAWITYAWAARSAAM
ncbi:MAG: MFS transporter [Bifidobacterium sp.]|jgi:predicted MFS family arabinose efflux permease|nr:MFS transporter [Bifidobacterium sp.]